MRRCILSGQDIDRIVLTMPQSQILEDMETSKLRLKYLTAEDVGLRFYWEDRLKAYDLAYQVSLYYEPDIASVEERELAMLQAQNDALRQRLVKPITDRHPKHKARKGLGY